MNRVVVSETIVICVLTNEKCCKRYRHTEGYCNAQYDFLKFDKIHCKTIDDSTTKICKITNFFLTKMKYLSSKWVILNLIWFNLISCACAEKINRTFCLGISVNHEALCYIGYVAVSYQIYSNIGFLYKKKLFIFV